MNKAQTKRYNTLYEKHINALIRQGKAETTIDAYTRAVRRITEYFDRCPDKMTLEHLETYFTALAKSHSWSTVRADRNGLQFFYKYVLNKEWLWVDIIKPPKQKVLPDILTRQQIEFVINHTRELRYQTFILTVYSMGLRLGEALNLKVGDIDSQRMRVHIRQGKGKKDRFVTLPKSTLQALRKYWATHRHPKMLFPNGTSNKDRAKAIKPMDRGGLQKSFKAIIASCNIHKQITIHNLRHCYGAHLLEVGVHLRKIQKEMGHDCPKTTAIYTQLTNEAEQNSGELINGLINSLNIHWHRGVNDEVS